MLLTVRHTFCHHSHAVTTMHVLAFLSCLRHVHCLSLSFKPTSHKQDQHFIFLKPQQHTPASEPIPGSTSFSCHKLYCLRPQQQTSAPEPTPGSTDFSCHKQAIHFICLLGHSSKHLLQNQSQVQQISHATNRPFMQGTIQQGSAHQAMPATSKPFSAVCQTKVRKFKQSKPTLVCTVQS